MFRVRQAPFEVAPDHGISPRHQSLDQGRFSHQKRPSLPDDIAFLENRIIDRQSLNRAMVMARRMGVAPTDLLMTLGWIAPENYYRCLARHLDLRFQSSGLKVDFIALRHHRLNDILRGHSLPIRGERHLNIAIAPSGRNIAHLIQTARMAPGLKTRVIITTPQAIIDGLTRSADSPILRHACRDLADTHPHASASRRFSRWQATWLLCLLSSMIGLTALLGQSIVAAGLTWGLSAIFAATWFLRLSASTQPMLRSRLTPLSEADLPVYSVLVPIYKETRVIPRLIAALGAIDYPRSKLDIILVAESDDDASLAALAAIGRPPHMRLIICPPCLPRTKPKALNVALRFARGSLITIFDAEDMPAPDQLRLAAAIFAREDHSLGCLQAALAYENNDENWLTRHCAIEYAALFDAILPGLARMLVPFPLGGTSNHFRRHALDTVGAWDPYNVTEDADLGIRLARHGYRLDVLASTTMEEAPNRFGNWLAQRTRWMKGWMQTALVHTRQPRRTARELGFLRAFSLIIIVVGIVGSSLVHPWSLGLIIYHLAQAGDDTDRLQTAIAHLALANLLCAYIAGIIAALSGIGRRRLFHLVPTALSIPVYWLLCSIAAHRAVLELMIRPFYWYRTAHGRSRFIKMPTPAHAARMVENERYRSLRSTSAATDGSAL